MEYYSGWFDKLVSFEYHIVDISKYDVMHFSTYIKKKFRLTKDKSLGLNMLTLKTHLIPVLYTIANLPVQCFGCEE